MPLLDMATSDTTPRVSTFSFIVSCFQTVALLLGDYSALSSRPMPQKFWSISMSSAHSPTFQSLHLHHNSFSNPSVALPTSELILQPFRCFTTCSTLFFIVSWFQPVAFLLGDCSALCSRSMPRKFRSNSRSIICSVYWRSSAFLCVYYFR